MDGAPKGVYAIGAHSGRRTNVLEDVLIQKVAVCVTVCVAVCVAVYYSMLACFGSPCHSFNERLWQPPRIFPELC